MINLFLWHSFKTLGISDISSAQTQCWISFKSKQRHNTRGCTHYTLMQKRCSSSLCFCPFALMLTNNKQFSEHKNYFLSWYIWKLCCNVTLHDVLRATSPPGGGSDQEALSPEAIYQHQNENFHMLYWWNYDCFRSSKLFSESLSEPDLR